MDPLGQSMTSSSIAVSQPSSPAPGGETPRSRRSTRHHSAAPSFITATAASALLHFIPASSSRVSFASKAHDDGHAEDRCGSCGEMQRGEHKCSSQAATNCMGTGCNGSSFLPPSSNAHSIFAASVVIEREPEAAPHWSRRAQLYQQAGLWRHACSDWSEAARLQPEEANHLLQRGLCWYEAGEYALALMDLSCSHSMRPSAAACNASGHAYRALHLLPQSIADYQRVSNSCMTFRLAMSQSKQISPRQPLTSISLGLWALCQAVALEPHVQLYATNLESACRAQQQWMADAAQAASSALAGLRREELASREPHSDMDKDRTSVPTSAPLDSSSTPHDLDCLQVLSGLAAANPSRWGQAAAEQAEEQRTRQDEDRLVAQRSCQQRLQQLQTHPNPMGSSNPNSTSSEGSASGPGSSGSASYRKRTRACSPAQAACRALWGDSAPLSLFVGGEKDDECSSTEALKRRRLDTEGQGARIHLGGRLLYSFGERRTDPPNDQRLEPSPPTAMPAPVSHLHLQSAGE